MNLWFLVDSAAWSAETLAAANTPELGGGIGGAEALLIGLSQRLARLGHTVTIWATQCAAPGIYHGPVTWRPVEREFRHALLSEPSPDLLVSVRRPEAFSLPEMAAYHGPKVLWAQDILDPAQGMIGALSQVDVIVYMSAWHQAQWAQVHPPVALKYSWITPSALDWAWMAAPAHQRDRFIYASRPERGLLPLLAMWPRIRAALPSATLAIGGYSQGVAIAAADAVIARVHAEVGGLEIVRAPDKVGFFRELAKARLLLYPGIASFAETNGHVVSDAMAAGVIPLVSRRGALPETVPDTVATFFDGDALTPAYQDAFVAETLRLASPNADDEVAIKQTRGQRWALGRCEFDVVTPHWHSAMLALKDRCYV